MSEVARRLRAVAKGVTGLGEYGARRFEMFTRRTLNELERSLVSARQYDNISAAKARGEKNTKALEQGTSVEREVAEAIRSEQASSGAPRAEQESSGPDS